MMEEKISLSPNRCRRTELIAYLAGLVASDGHIDKNSNRIEIATSNKRFAGIVYTLLQKVTCNPPHIYQHSSAYTVEVWDEKLCKTLTTKFKIPRGKKSDVLNCPEIFSTSEISNFIRGFCDGDSSPHYRRMRNKLVPRIRIMSTSKSILEWIRNQLKKLNIGCSSPFMDMPHGFGCKVCWRIEIYGNNVKTFVKKVGYLHPEKKEKLDKLLLLS
jgi:hypothetical protein